jgi:hypothetical protein
MLRLISRRSITCLAFLGLVLMQPQFAAAASQISSIVQNGLTLTINGKGFGPLVPLPKVTVGTTTASWQGTLGLMAYIQQDFLSGGWNLYCSFDPISDTNYSVQLTWKVEAIQVN